MRTWSGFVYAALFIDAYSRMILGCQVSGSLGSDLALDVPQMALWRRGDDVPAWCTVATAPCNICLTRKRGPWKTPEDVELDTLE